MAEKPGITLCYKLVNFRLSLRINNFGLAEFTCYHTASRVHFRNSVLMVDSEVFYRQEWSNNIRVQQRLFYADNASMRRAQCWGRGRQIRQIRKWKSDISTSYGQKGNLWQEGAFKNSLPAGTISSSGWIRGSLGYSNGWSRACWGTIKILNNKTSYLLWRRTKIPF